MVNEVFGPFIEGSPVSVMFRATLERMLSAPKMDAIFSQAATRQKTGELLFSTCVDLMALVVAKVRKSVHAAYRAQAERMQVSVRSIYNKLAGIEPQVCERMVSATGGEMAALLSQMGVRLQSQQLAGYDVRVVDGNYLAGTEHRLAELRRLGAAALPGMTLCIYDPQCQLVRAVVACQDGHANERSLVDRVVPHVEAGQCWVADRNFCFFAFLFGVAARQAFFVVRQHPQVVGELLRKRRKLRRVEGGTLYEQALSVNRHGENLVLRRITLELDQPTRSEETEIHLLTNLPPETAAGAIAAVYRDRWSLETAFMHLATVLRSEVNTLGYPDAALFGFSIGLLLYNVLSFLETALHAAHRRKLGGHSLLMYYLADEISGVYRGMLIAIPAPHWTAAFATLTPEAFVKQMLRLAKKVQITQFFTNPPSQKKPPPKRQSGYRGNHVATFRVLQKRIPTR
jgi:hypothetical protein